MTKAMSPSEITAGQIGKICDLLSARLRKSRLPSEAVQQVIEHQGDELADEVVSLVRTRVEAVSVTFTRHVTIARNRFNPAEFIGQGWSIITDETDTRSTALTELDLTKVQQVTMLKDGETYVKGEEKLKRLKTADYIRLGADVFLALWENQHLIPESWKEKVGGNTRYIFFDGTVVRDSDGSRYVLYLFWSDGAWRWSVGWLDSGWGGSLPSAVLAS